ncbi:VWA domain-containing protein [Luteolibacter yonseiensis]|uniref:VWA domain-containing protein n=1 Tax=Luteolibacter yonseiensis TaxID=1144680 RepID=A0A934R211_9BACT|nr:VWA domain-containing protein [Luteolibacter yonseiensis]
MITLASPWLLLVLPLPLLSRALLPPHREPRPSLHVPFLDRLSRVTGRQPGEGASVPVGTLGRRWVMPFVWLCLVVALARPQWIEPPVSKALPTRDLMIAVDLSGSMETKDFTDASGKSADRLTAVKQVLDGFLSKREGDRVGLLFFGTAPFVQAPFTTDLKVCRQLLDEAQVRMAGPQTAFGDAIGLAITLFERSTMKQKVLIVLTDGNDTASRIPPAKAAEIAKGKGIVIHTVSVGDPRAAGEEALDVPTLQAVAAESGGIYSAASDRRQLEQIYEKLDALETLSTETVSRRPRRDVHHWFIAAAFVLSGIYQTVLVLMRTLRFRPARAPITEGREVPLVS